VTKFGCWHPAAAGSVAAAVFGIAGVVAVLVGVLSIAAGFRGDGGLGLGGRGDRAPQRRRQRDGQRLQAREHAHHRRRAGRGAHRPRGPLASAELFVIINLPKRSTGTDANVPLRGVERAAFRVRDQLKIVEGRMFEWGKNEVIVGVGAAREFAGLQVGSTIHVGRREWPVVGVFSPGGGTAESEIWTDATVLQAAYNRGDSFQSVYARLNSPGRSPPSRMP
jgi:putative ABC transport system permease protein